MDSKKWLMQKLWLESEVGALRVDIKSLKILINGSEPSEDQANKIKI